MNWVGICADENLRDDLRQAFVEWFNASLRLVPRWSTSALALYASFCAWMFEHDLAAPAPVQFRCLLEELGYEVRDAGGELLVPNVAFKEDLKALAEETR